MLNKYDQNTVTLTGIITTPKRLHDNIVSLSVCQKETYQNGNERRETTHYLDVSFLNMGKVKLADWIEQELRAGDEIRVEGFLSTRKRDVNGTPVTTMRIVGRKYKLLSTKESREALHLVRKIRLEEGKEDQPQQQANPQDANASSAPSQQGTQATTPTAGQPQEATPPSSPSKPPVQTWGSYETPQASTSAA